MQVQTKTFSSKAKKTFKHKFAIRKCESRVNNEIGIGLPSLLPVLVPKNVRWERIAEQLAHWRRMVNVFNNVSLPIFSFQTK